MEIDTIESVGGVNDGSDAVEEVETVYQILYISAATHDFTEEELQELLTLARTKNEERGVSGMLLFHEGSFIQALEGKQEHVEEIYGKIGQDSRHTETQILFKGDIDHRDFDGWSMGFYRSNQSSARNLEGFHQFLQRGFRNKDEETNSSRARKALLSFREGNWRQHVDV
ncbi:BLUF domain-containing protein [Granulosicoccus sp. 3-233]|uniref:BLUF domain-containing protein n=1 Tax=Granulosicoccus sp. 3-233 TaxID=3417969 RepID=UPI003D32E7F1